MSTSRGAITERTLSPADLLLRTSAGRVFLVSAALKLVVGVLRALQVVPQLVTVLSGLSTLGIIVSLGFFVWRLFVLTKRRLLWAVRRRLILSYIFIGVVPALLIVTFFLVGSVLMFTNISAYLFKDGYDKAVNDVNLATRAAASELARAPDTEGQTLSRIQRNVSARYRELSFAYVPAAAGVQDGPLQPLQVGSWRHGEPPKRIPAWITRSGWSGTVTQPIPVSADEVDLVARAVAAVVINDRLVGYVAGDLPVDGEMIQKLQDSTGVRAGTATPVRRRGEEQPVAVANTVDADRANDGGWASLFRKSVIFLGYSDWETGQVRRVSVALSYRPAELYSRLADAQKLEMPGGAAFGVIALWSLLLVAGLFLIIEMVALSMGLALARSITSSVHELFTGTERVRHGDFGHRIDVHTNDQLGELAGSFNEMTGSIEGLLQTAAEKKRLEEELRIARAIQMSLLPRGPIDVPGLGITALCVPAREVGGDYYDFFRLPGDRLGILIADVAGKGTSAALYMAELKGLVLALSQRYDSPRELLIEVNRIISEHLDSRSFITASYAVVDLECGTMRFCRAGHTPLIFFSAAEPSAQVLTPNGMVLGLRIEAAENLFPELLEELRIELTLGDVIVLYTDGITEAMNPDSDLFGEGRLSRLVEEHGHLDSGELRERIMREVESFVGAANQHDDMTMILVKVERTWAAAERVAV